MPRGYRGIILAAVGVALASPCVGQHDKAEKAQRDDTSGAKLDRIAAALAKLPQAQPPDGGCPDGQDERRSDLCAQWKAADAATEAASWTFGTLIAAFAGLGIGVGTLVAAIKAASWAKKAAIETEKAAKAAMDAVAETREANKTATAALALERDRAALENRPWLSFDNFEISHILIRQDGERWVIRPHYTVTIRNTGPVPAKSVRIYSHGIRNPLKPECIMEMEGVFSYHTEGPRGLSLGIIAANGQTKNASAPQFAMPVTESDGFENRNVWPAIGLSVTYMAFDKDTLYQTAQMFSAGMRDPDNPKESGIVAAFWLANDRVNGDEIVYAAGSDIDRAT